MEKRAVVFGARVTTAQLYPGRDALESDKGHVTKNQSITSLVLLNESLGIEQTWILTINMLSVRLAYFRIT